MPSYFSPSLWKLALTVMVGFCVAACYASAENASASHSQLGHFVCALSVPEKVSQSDLDRVLRFVAGNRRWVLVEQGGGYTELSLNHRGISSHVYLYQEGRLLTMRHLSRDAKGASTTPDRWFRNLQKDIEAQLASKL